MHGGDIKFQISPPSGIMESCEGTTGVISLLRELLILLIPRLDQFLVHVSPAYFQGWKFPGHSEHLCQCWTTFEREEDNFLEQSQNFPYCKLCLLPLTRLFLLTSVFYLIVIGFLHSPWYSPGGAMSGRD